MARAYTIWIVQTKGCITPEAAFTVKHELITWLSKYSKRDQKNFTVWRMPDGREAPDNVSFSGDMIA